MQNFNVPKKQITKFYDVCIVYRMKHIEDRTVFPKNR